MTQEEDKGLLKFLREQEAKGYIRPSISPYASPFFFIQKKDGKLRPVQDYRRINDITISNQYPYHSLQNFSQTSAELNFHQTRRTRRVQQYPNQGGRRTQSRIQNQIRPVRTLSHVFWVEKLTSYVPKHDELRISRHY
jgi:hypothetical protein